MFRRGGGGGGGVLDGMEEDGVPKWKCGIYGREGQGRIQDFGRGGSNKCIQKWGGTGGGMPLL